MQGFARLCSDRYDSSGTDLDNRMVHLTNASVQRFGESYNASHGNKWSLDSLRLYLESTRGKNETDKLFARIRELVVVSLRACSRVIVQDKCALFNSSLKRVPLHEIALAQLSELRIFPLHFHAGIVLSCMASTS